MMKTFEPYSSKSKLPPLRSRRAISASSEELVEAKFLQPHQFLPLVVTPALEEVNLVAWAKQNRDFIEAELGKWGGLLFRNFKVSDPTQFEEFITAVSGELLEYRERSSPRSRVRGNIYTSTDFPAAQSIFLHNENSYQHTWPMKIFFFCLKAATAGGETPLADVRKVLKRIDPKSVDIFTQKQVMYVRNFGSGLGLHWHDVFQTTDKLKVEEYCQNRDIEVEWKYDNCLRTRQVRHAILKHPKTGEKVWFNHAAFFHVSTLEPVLRESLLADFKESDLPNNTYYGDGTPIEPSVLDEVREAYRQETVTFPWQEGDILMLDNMLVAHGRSPFVGSRKIAVGMSETYSYSPTRVETPTS
jgi:alpha-ketoglutarate-dependent taurine dioxygenase